MQQNYEQNTIYTYILTYTFVYKFKYQEQKINYLYMPLTPKQQI